MEQFGNLNHLKFFPQLLTEQSRLFGDKTFISSPSDNQTRSLSYAQLDQLSNSFANWLDENNLLQKKKIALAPQNDLVSVVAIFGLLRTAIPTLIINPNYPESRIEKIMEAVGIDTFLSIPDAPCSNFTKARVIPTLEEITQSDKTYSPQRIELQDEAFFFATSGSTAASKIVVQTHLNLSANAEAVRQHHNLDPSVKFLGCLPICHVNGFHFTLMANFLSGSEVMLLKEFNPFDYSQHLGLFQPHIASIVPSVLEMLLVTLRASQIPDNFRYFVTAASALSKQSQKDLYERFSTKVIQGYGLTETTNFSLTMPIDLKNEDYEHLMNLQEIPPAGIAVYGNEVEILNDKGHVMAEKETGEICIRGLNLMPGYYHASSENETREYEWFHTGDIGYYFTWGNPKRQYIVITGRKKNIAKVKGHNVSLEEMERSLCQLDIIKDAACISVHEKLYGEYIIAAIVLKNALSIVASNKLKQHLSEYFPQDVLPRKFVSLSSIPKSNTGKLIRKKIEEKIKNAPGL